MASYIGRMKKKIVVLSGAGMSAESGISTFRDAGGLWEGHDIMEVASPQGWARNPELVLDFYNKRRRQLHEVEPNPGHDAIARLEKEFDVTVITQNVDDLHERAGSTNIVHLHGELFKVRSTVEEDDVLEWRGDLTIGDTNARGHQLRPHIVWFGEMVPELERAAAFAAVADVFIVVGTSMQVYPAAGLVDFVRPHVPMFYIDPKPAQLYGIRNKLTVIPMRATDAMPVLLEYLKEFT